MVELTVDPPYDGHETVICAADENYLGQPTAEVIEAATGRMPEPCDVERRSRHSRTRRPTRCSTGHPSTAGVRRRRAIRTRPDLSPIRPERPGPS